MQETWKAIQGYEELYEVSDLGRVKSLVDKNGRNRELFISHHKDRKGYLQVDLHKNGVKKMYKLHRLVALAFVEGRDLFKNQVNHLNEDKTDNRAINLEWATASENINHGTRNKRVAETLSLPIVQLTLDYKFVAKWPSAMEAERCRFNNSNIIQCCRHKRKIVSGYRWFYLSEYEELCYKVVTAHHPFRLALPYRA